MNQRCPNCNAPLGISQNGRTVLCEYCGSEIEVVKPEPQQKAAEPENTEGKKPAQLLFDYKHVQEFSNDALLRSYQEMCAWINSGDTVETCLDWLNDIAMQNKEWATERVHSDLLFRMKAHAGYLMHPAERALLYKDSGVFSLGKTGMLITDRGIYTIKKNQIHRLLFSEVFAINAYGLIMNSCTWYFNGEQKVEVDNMVCTPEQAGVIMAMICLMVRDSHAPGFQIKVFNGCP